MLHLNIREMIFISLPKRKTVYIMIWNPWWGSINTDNEAFPYLKEIINLVNVNSLVTTVFMVDEDEKTVGIHSHCHTFFLTQRR